MAEQVDQALRDDEFAFRATTACCIAAFERPHRSEPKSRGTRERRSSQARRREQPPTQKLAMLRLTETRSSHIPRIYTATRRRPRKTTPRPSGRARATSQGSPRRRDQAVRRSSISKWKRPATDDRRLPGLREGTWSPRRMPRSFPLARTLSSWSPPFQQTKSPTDAVPSSSVAAKDHSEPFAFTAVARRGVIERRSCETYE